MEKLMKTKAWTVMIALMFLFLVNSCSQKGSDQISKDENEQPVEMATVNDNDFEESDEDLLKVDYKEFYSQLEPHGEWIEVKGDEVGLESDLGTAGGTEERSITLSELFGINSAYADEVGVGGFFVWKPAPELAVSLATATGEPRIIPNDPVQYVPYTNGQWNHTDAGWYFRAPTPQEEIVHHYGRWYQSQTLGWVWVPGRVWSPAWVDWRENDNYVAWAPVPPSVYVVNDVIEVPVIPEANFVFVEKRYFVQPAVYQYVYPYRTYNDVIVLSDMRRLDGVTVVNSTLVNTGPQISVIERFAGTKIEPLSITRVTRTNEITSAGNKINTYTPKFNRSKDRVKKIISKPPKSVKSFDRINKGSGNDKSSGQKNDNSGQNKGKDNTIEKQFKGNDNSSGKDNNINKQNNERVKPKGNNDNKIKSNDPGNQNKSKGNDQVKPKNNNPTNDNKSGNKNNDKGGNKNKGNNGKKK